MLCMGGCLLSPRGSIILLRSALRNFEGQSRHCVFIFQIFFGASRNVPDLSKILASLKRKFWLQVAISHQNFSFKRFELAATYFPPGGVSSALQRFTTLFGMRRGSSTASSHQLETLNNYCILVREEDLPASRHESSLKPPKHNIRKR